MSKLLKTYLQWEKGGEAPLNHHVLVKKLVGVGIHTFIGMLGYCVKDKGEDNLRLFIMLPMKNLKLDLKESVGKVSMLYVTCTSRCTSSWIPPLLEFFYRCVVLGLLFNRWFHDIVEGWILSGQMQCGNVWLCFLHSCWKTFVRFFLTILVLVPIYVIWAARNLQLIWLQDMRVILLEMEMMKRILMLKKISKSWR